VTNTPFHLDIIGQITRLAHQLLQILLEFLQLADSFFDLHGFLLK
jgi:hypothetical protein